MKRKIRLARIYIFRLLFEFLKDGKKCTSFPFGINFTGWRAAWVCYERDMQGIPEEGMNELRIVAPNSKGRLFIDHLITSTKVDARQQTADLQATGRDATVREVFS